MKNKAFLLFGLVAFVSIFSWQSCSLVKVDSPEIDVTSEYTPVYYIKGVISNSDGAQGIEGATINIGEISLTSDSEGNYSYKSENPITDRTIVEVLADGFVKSTATINYGEEAPIEYFLDFSLTRELQSNTINLAAGGEVSFVGGKLVIPDNNSVVLDGNTLDNIDISVTPLSPFSALGDWVGESIQRLKFEPEGAEFDKPVIAIFDVPEDVNFSDIALYSFNNTTNTWETTDYTIVYDEINNQISFELKILPLSIHAASPASITITKDTVYLEAAVRYSPNTCDCEASYNWFGGYYIRQIELAAGTGSLSELNSLYFFTNYGMPYSTALINGIPVSPAVPAPGIFIPACKQVDVDVSRMYREVEGTYDFAGETGKTFTVRYYFAVDVLTTTVDCPLYSNCHQGCL